VEDYGILGLEVVFCALVFTAWGQIRGQQQGIWPVKIPGHHSKISYFDLDRPAAMTSEQLLKQEPNR